MPMRSARERTFPGRPGRVSPALAGAAPETGPRAARAGLLLGAALLATAAFALPVHAQTTLLVGNVTGTTDINNGPGLDFSTSEGGNPVSKIRPPIGQEFTTGANPRGYRIESVEMFLGGSSAFKDDDIPTVAVCPLDSNGDPDHDSQSCVELTSPEGPFGPANMATTTGEVYTAPSDTVLSANTTHSLYIAGMGSGGRLHIVTSNDEDSDGQDDWSLANNHQLFTDSSGYPSTQPTEWRNATSTPAALKVKINGVVLADPPPQVTGVRVFSQNGGRLLVDWTEVEEADGYKVQWKSGSDDYDATDRQDTVSGGTTTHHTIDNLTGGTAYDVRVIATRSGAADGTPSAEATGTPNTTNKATASVFGLFGPLSGSRTDHPPGDRFTGRVAIWVQFSSGAPSGLETDDLEVAHGTVRSWRRSGNFAVFEVDVHDPDSGTDGNPLEILIKEDVVSGGNNAAIDVRWNTAEPFTGTLSSTATEPVPGDFTLINIFNEDVSYERSNQANLGGDWPRTLGDLVPRVFRVTNGWLRNPGRQPNGNFLTSTFTEVHLPVRPIDHFEGDLVVNFLAGGIKPLGESRRPSRTNSSTSFTIQIDTNRPPRSRNAVKAVDENTTDNPFAEADFPFIDPPRSGFNAHDEFHSLEITDVAGVTEGNLEFNGAPVTAPQVIPVADIPDLTFTPVEHRFGADYGRFEFMVSDGTKESAVFTMTINVDPVNAPPTASDQEVTTLEDTTYTFMVDDFGYMDTDFDNQDLISVEITELEPEGALQLDGADVGLNDVIMGTAIANGDLKFVPDENGSQIAAYSFFRFSVNDGIDDSVATYQMNIFVTPVNDAPTSADNTVTINEDTEHTFSQGEFEFDDVDIFETFHSLRLESLPTEGRLFNGNTEVTTAPATLTSTNIGGLRFVPDPDANGSPYATFPFRVISSGTPVGQDQSAVHTMTINVTPVEDAPTAADGTVSTNRSQPYTFVPGDFGFMDADEDDVLVEVRIDTVETVGDLELDGSGVTASQTITTMQLEDGELVFTPSTTDIGAPYSTFGFSVSDGKAYSASFTMNVNVTTVDMRPTASDRTVTATEDMTYAFQVDDFGFMDGDQGDTLGSVQITALNLVGDLHLGGTAVTMNQIVPVASLTAGDLTFASAPDENGAAYATFEFKVGDDDGTLSEAAYTMTIDVDPANDPPTASDRSVDVPEDTRYSFDVSEFGFMDIDDGDDELASVWIRTLPAAGNLTSGGTPVVAGQVVPYARIDNGQLAFMPEPNGNGPAYATFEFSVNDGEADSVSSYTMTINVDPVDDAPTSADNAVTTDEDVAYTFSQSEFAFMDVDGDTFQDLEVLGPPTAGRLRLRAGSSDITSSTAIPAGRIQQLMFIPDANEHGDSDPYPYATFEFFVYSSRAEQSTTYTMTVNVAPVNDAPTASDGTVSTVVSMPYEFMASDFGFMDVDAGDALASVRITTLENVGDLELGTTPVTLDQDIPVADISTLVFTPAVDAEGTPYATFGFSVSDGTLASAAYTMNINVSSGVPPTASDQTVTATEDMPYAFQVDDFGFMDADGDTLGSVQVATLPSPGSLTLDGVAVTMNQVVTVASLTSGDLTFTPAPDGIGDAYATFRFKVGDNRGSLSEAAYTMTIDVEPANDPPTGAPSEVTTDEDVAYTFRASDFSFTDVDGDDLASVRIVTLPSGGDLTLGGAAVTADQVIQATAIGTLTFAPAADANGVAYADFRFRVNDGAADSVDAYVMTINVTPVNDPPTASDGEVTTDEDLARAFAAGEFGFMDIDAGDTLGGVRITTDATAGGLQLDGQAVAAPRTIPAADLSDLMFVPAPDGNGSPYATFEFRVEDAAGAPSDLAYTMTVDVTPRPDAPTAADGTVSTSENMPYGFRAEDFGFMDADDGDTLASVQVTSDATAGNLQLGGQAVNVPQMVPAADISNLTFVPELDGNGSPYAMFGFIVSDGENDSVEYTMNINVTPADSVPTAMNVAVTTEEDTAHAFAADEFGFMDADDGDMLGGVQVTTLEDAGELALDGTAVTVNQVIPAADIPDLTFTPAADANGSPYATFGFKVTDRDGTPSAMSHVMSINVTPVADAPTAADGTVVTTENVSYVFRASDFGFMDADGDTLASVQVTTVESAGDLEFNSADVTTVPQTIPVASITGLILSPDSGQTGSPYATFEFMVTDSAGTPSESTYTMTLNVTSADLPPEAVDGTVSTNEDTAYEFSGTDFGFTDPDLNDVLGGVQITTLESAGELELAGAAVAVNQVIAAADIPMLSFTPAPDANGDAYATFGFKVTDSDGTPSLLPNIMTIDVTAVADAPTAADGTVTTSEDTPYVFQASDFGFMDADRDLLASVQVTTEETAGDLELDGQPVTASQVIPAANISDLVFTPAAGANGSPYATFGFSVNDGTDDSVAYMMSINVTSADSAPTAADGRVSTSEGMAYVFRASDFGFMDADVGDTLGGVQITTLEDAGDLEFDGADVVVNQVIAAARISDLVFTPAAGARGSPYATFGFKVTDSDGTPSAEAYTMTVDVTAVNRAPTAANGEVTTGMDTAYVFRASDFGFMDADAGDALASVWITTTPAVGDLTLGGAAVVVDQVIEAADISNLVFTPAAGASGSPYATFQFRVSDGADESAVAYTMTVNVTADMPEPPPEPPAERPMLTVTVTDPTVHEGGDATYTVVLDSEPTGTVTVTVEPQAALTMAGVTVSPTVLVFTADDWDESQTVTLTRVDDNTEPEVDVTAAVTHTVSGDDYEEGEVQVPGMVSVMVLGFEVEGDAILLRVPPELEVTVPDSEQLPPSLGMVEGVTVELPPRLIGDIVSVRSAAGQSTTPPGYASGDVLVDITLVGEALTTGETATVCIPSTRGGQRVYLYDEDADPPEWVALPPAPGSPPGLTCGVTTHFSLFALGVPETAADEQAEKGWLARFGRSVATQVVEAIGARMNASATQGAKLSLGGSSPQAAVLSGVMRMLSGRTELDAKQTLAKSSFVLPLTEGGDRRWTAWGRGAYADFEGEESGVDLDGEVSTGTVGVDLTRGDWLAGVALSHSDGDGDSRNRDGGRGEMDISLTTVSPYAKFELAGGLSAWGVAGWGEGDLERKRGGEETEVDLEMQMAAAGVERPVAVIRGVADDFGVTLKADALLMRMEADGETDLPSVESDAQRFRLLLSGRGRYGLASGGTLSPNLEAGLRWDEGDAETGLGVETGAGLGFADAGGRLSAELKARALVAHEERGYEEWGVSGAVALNPERGGRGLSLRLESGYGPVESDTQALWARRDLAGLAPEEAATFDGRLGLDAGYGLNGPAGRGSWTPYLAYREGTEAELRFGTRLDLGEALRLDLSALRRDDGQDVGFRVEGRW